MIAPLAACFAEEQPTAKAASTPCESNFAVEGGFLKGNTYKTFQEFSGTSYDYSFRKTAQAVAANSWTSVNANKDAGVITASRAVMFGDGAVVPLNVVVQEKKDNVIRVDVNFSTGFGQMVSSDTVKIELCKIAEAAGRQQ